MIWFNNVTETVDGVAQVKNLIKVYTPNGWEIYGTTDADLQAVIARVTALEGAVATLKDVTLPALKAELEQAIAEAVAAEAKIARAAEEALGKRIDALAAKTVTINEKATGHVTVSKTVDAQGATVYTVAEKDIASAAALAKESEDARAAEKALADRLDIVEGEATVEGSIKKALADAKAYTDAAKAAIEGTLADDDAKTLEAINDELDTLAARGYKVAEVTEGLPANIERRYQLVDKTGAVIEGSVNIDVEKESALKNVELVSVDADGVDGNYLKWTYVLADGTEKVQYLNVSDLLVEAEFTDGLEVSAAGEVSVKIDDTSDEFLTVSADGVKLSGVQDAIDAAEIAAQKYTDDSIAALDSDVTSAATYTVTDAEGVESAVDHKVRVQVVEEDGVVTEVNVTESDIASAAALATLDAEVQEHEQIVSAALNDLHARIEGVAQDLADKNVDAEGDAYVSATTADNKVTIAATESTKASLALADSAVQTVASKTLQVTREANAVNVELCWMEGSF
jgi:hypothetical protein